MAIQVLITAGRDDVAVVVPTASHTGPVFPGFVDSLHRSMDPPPTMIVVESAGPGFNFSRSINAGIGAALARSPKWVILSNDDIRFPHDWWGPMHRAFEQVPHLAY